MERWGYAVPRVAWSLLSTRGSTTKQRVGYENGEFMLGYQHYFGATRVSLYAGANVAVPAVNIDG